MGGSCTSLRKRSSSLSLNPEDRARGCLLGLAIGDALGFPLEGLTPRQIGRRFPDLSRYRFLGRTGYVSDDTEQAVQVAEALLEGGDPVQAFRRKLRAWFCTLPPGIGGATVRACLLGRGVASAGNGAAMRAAAVGLWHEYTDDLSRRIAEVTHTDPRGVDGARVVSAAVARLVRGESAAWPELGLTLDERLEEALTQAWEARAEPPSERARLLGTSGYVLHSVPLAFSALWSEPPDYLSGLLDILRQGGDADSNGAIAGALLGARWGVQGLPAAYLEDLESGYGRARLEPLARALRAGRLHDYQSPGFLARRARELVIKAGVGMHVLRRMIPW